MTPGPTTLQPLSEADARHSEDGKLLSTPVALELERHEQAFVAKEQPTVGNHRRGKAWPIERVASALLAKCLGRCLRQKQAARLRQDDEATIGQSDCAFSQAALIPGDLAGAPGQAAEPGAAKPVEMVFVQHRSGEVVAHYG